MSVRCISKVGSQHRPLKFQKRYLNFYLQTFIFDPPPKKGNKLRGKYKKINDDSPIYDVYDKNGNKLDGAFRKDESEDPENEVYDLSKALQWEAQQH